MGKRKLKSFICMLLCICMLIPQSGLAWGAQSGNGLKPDTEDLEIHVGEVFGSGGGVSSKDRSNLKLDEVWKDVTGKGVNVAVIDGGANLNDPAIKSRIKGVYNAKTGSTKRSDISSDSHGTSCAKILVGVAPKVNLYIIQAGKDGYIYSDQVEKGLAYAKSKKCRVISMSFGGDTYSQWEYNVINNLYTAPVNSGLVCASGGNSGKKEYHYAASYDNTLSVGAAKYNSGKKQYVVIPKGTYNDKMDVVAPGGTTSASAPFAAGVAALLFQAKPSMTAKECRDIINATAKDLGAKGYDSHYGHGLIQPLEALRKVKGYGITLKQTKAVIQRGKSVMIKIKSIRPKSDRVKSYVSSNKSVASVNSKGKVTGKKKGKAKITVTTKKGSKAVFQVTVK